MVFLCDVVMIVMVGMIEDDGNDKIAILELFMHFNHEHTHSINILVRSL